MTTILLLQITIKYDQSILLYSGCLLQQYIVDMYIKLETTKLDYYRRQQSKIRAKLYQGIVYSVLTGGSKASKVGKRIVLPASFVGGWLLLKKCYFIACN